MTANDRLAEIRMRVDAISDENPFSYDPWDDDSVDPTNTGDVVHAAVSRGWDAGVKAEAPALVAALEAVLAIDPGEPTCAEDVGYYDGIMAARRAINEALGVDQ